MILHDLNTPYPFRKIDEQGKATPAYKAVNVETAKRIFRNKLDSLQILSPYNPEEKKLIDFQNLHGYDYKSIGGMLSVFRVGRTDYLQIDGLTEHPEMSSFVVNKLYEQYLRYYTKVKKVNVTESIDTLKMKMYGQICIWVN